MELDAVLDLLWGDVLSTGRDDEVLLTVGDLQVAVLVKLTDVAGVHPSLGIDQLTGRRLILVVTGAHVAAPRQDLAVVGDLQLDSRQRGADRADLDRVRWVPGSRPVVLRLPIALRDLQADRMKEPDEVWVDRRGSR